MPKHMSRKTLAELRALCDAHKVSYDSGFTRGQLMHILRQALCCTGVGTDLDAPTKESQKNNVKAGSAEASRGMAQVEVMKNQSVLISK